MAWTNSLEASPGQVYFLKGSFGGLPPGMVFRQGDKALLLLLLLTDIGTSDPELSSGEQDYLIL